MEGEVCTLDAYEAAAGMPQASRLPPRRQIRELNCASGRTADTETCSLRRYKIHHCRDAYFSYFKLLSPKYLFPSKRKLYVGVSFAKIESNSIIS